MGATGQLLVDRAMVRGRPEDTLLGTYLLDPNGNIKDTNSATTLLYLTREPGEPFLIHVSIPGSVAKGNTPVFTADAPFKFEIYDVIVIPSGAETGGTLQLDDGTTVITDAMTCAVDKTIARATTIDDAKSTIAASGSLRILTASSGTDQCGADVWICCVRLQ